MLRLRDRQLGADDGAEAGGFGGLMKARRAVDAVTIEERKDGIAESGSALDQRFGQRRAAEKRKRRRSAKLDVGHDGEEGKKGRTGLRDSEKSGTEALKKQPRRARRHEEQKG